MILPKLTPQDDPGLRRLAKAVVTQALEDLTLGDVHSCTAAWDWLQGHNTEGLTFETCCSLLGHRPDDLRRRLLAARHSPQPTVAPAPKVANSQGGAGYQLAS